MNRYTQLTPAQFDPLSLQEIMMVPLAKQQQHDAQQAQIGDMGVQLNALQADTPYYESQVKDFRNRADSLTDELMSKGVGRGLTKNLMSLSRDRRNFLEGDGAKIQGAYDAYQANVKHIMDIPEKEMSMADKQIYLNHAANQYNQTGGVKAGASYNPYYGANTQDINAIASEYASKMTPQEIEEETGWKKVPRDGEIIWVNGNRTTKTLPYNEIATAVMNRLQGDRGVMSYMQALSQSTGQDYSPLMSQAALNAARQYQINDSSITEDMKTITDPKGATRGPAVFGGSNVYAYNHSTNTVFGNNANYEDVKINYEKLLNSNDPEQRVEGKRMQEHYNRAKENFESKFPELTKQYEEGYKLNTPVTNQIEKRLNLKDGLFSGRYKYKDDNYGGWNVIDEVTGQKVGNITETESSKSQEEKWLVFDQQKEYIKEFNNYLDNYADNTRSYLLTNLKSADGNVINKDITNMMRALPTTSIKASNVILNGESISPDKNYTFNKDVDELLKLIKGGSIDTELISFTPENEKGLPSMKIRFDNGDDEKGVMDIQLDDLYTDGSFAQDIDNYVMNQYAMYGGTDGKIIADRAKDKMKYKNVYPNLQKDFKEDPIIKSHVNQNIKEKLKSKLPNYKLDLIRNDSGSGKKEYAIAFGNEKGNRNLNWGDIFNTADDFMDIGTTTIARYLYSEMEKEMGNKITQIDEAQLREYLDKIISEKKVIKTDNYIDLMNLLSSN